MRRSTVALALLSVSLVFVGPRRARAQDDGNVGAAGRQDRLSLVVHGRATLPADQVDIELMVEGDGDEAVEAEKKHRDKLKAVVKALEELKRSLEGKSDAGESKEAAPKPEAKKKKPAADDDEDAPPKRKVKKKPVDDDDDDAPRPKAKKAAKGDDADPDDGDGPAIPGFTIELREGRSMIGVGAPKNNGTGAGTKAEPSVSVVTAVVVRMTGFASVPRARLRRRLAKILDAAVEAGADSGANGIGTRPAFRFKVKDNEELREAAHREAITLGKARAVKLARLCGRELGTLSNVAETAWTLRGGSTDAVGFDGAVGRLGNNKLNNYEMTTSSTEIELEVELGLDFELGKVVPEDAAPSGK